MNRADNGARHVALTMMNNMKSVSSCADARPQLGSIGAYEVLGDLAPARAAATMAAGPSGDPPSQPIGGSTRQDGYVGALRIILAGGRVYP